MQCTFALYVSIWITEQVSAIQTATIPAGFG